MRHVSFGRHRGADWLSRVAFPLDAAHPAHERFVLRLHDLKHPRALWSCLSLTRNAGATEARSSVAYFDGVAKKVHVAEESWPLSRAAIDVERGGLGVGECAVDASHAHGLVRGAGFALSWDVALTPLAGPATLLPSAWLYRHRRINQKASAPLPLGQVRAGRLELWHALGRDAPRTALDVAGWRASVSHNWCEQQLTHYGHVHAHRLEGGTDEEYFLAELGHTKLLGALELYPQLGILHLGPTPQHFVGPRALRGAGAWQATPHRLRMELLGPKLSTLVGEVQAEPALTATFAGPMGGQLYVSELAQLEATWTPPGAPGRAVRARAVSLELLAPQT